MSELLQHVGESFAERRLLDPGQKALVAVSGGLDSMVLLNILARLALEQRWRLTVAHFNHRLRGRSSDADERLVERTAGALGLRYICGRADVRKHARKQGVSLEMAARELRHRFLAGCARKSNTRTIVLAHHADDQVELFFLRLLRGSGGEGLAGMKWRNPSPEDSSILLVRPLLDQSKAALYAYAAEHKVRFREDATNAGLDFRRNRIRNEFLPLIEGKYQPAVRRVILRQMEILGAEADCVTGMAKAWLSAGKMTPLADLPVAVQRRALQLQAVEAGVLVSFELIEQLRSVPGAVFSVGESLSVACDARGRLTLHTAEKPVFDAGSVAAELTGRGGTLSIDNVTVTWARGTPDGTHLGSERLGAKAAGSSPSPREERAGRGPGRGVSFSASSGLVGSDGGTLRAQKGRVNCECFDADKVGESAVLRHWRPGDRFQPIGMANDVKLQDLFTNMKVPRSRRHELVVAENAAGEIFWVEGVRLGERFKLDKNTRRQLKWRWKRL